MILYYITLYDMIFYHIILNHATTKKPLRPLGLKRSKPGVGAVSSQSEDGSEEVGPGFRRSLL